MIADFRLPDLGEGLPEAELVQWLVAEGETVALNQTIAEVETAKAVVELPSPHAGTVAGLHAAAGDVVEVGSVLITFELEGEGEAVAEATSPLHAENHVAHDADETDDDRPQPNLVGYGVAPRAGGRPQRRARSARGAEAATGDTAVLEAAPHDVLPASDDGEVLLERPRSTPPVRKLAKDLGVDLALVAPTGEGDLITRSDVTGYAERVGSMSATAAAVAAPTTAELEREEPEVPASPSALSESGAARETRTPIRGVRRHTAAAMVRSAFTAPHVTTFLTVDVTAATELLTSLASDRALAGHRIGILAVAAKAVCLALSRTPSLNSEWDEDRGEIVEYRDVNLGIAVATPRGLVVPNVRSAEQLTLVELADAIGVLAQTARSGRTTPVDMMGGTFTITNIGVFGVDAGTPILNPGEAGILALGAIRRLPWEHRGEIALRDVMTLALSFDHRLVDGEQGARFLADVGAVLREPGRAMLMR